MDTNVKGIGSFDIGKSILKNKQEGGGTGADLAGLFDKMQIDVVGRENGNEEDSGLSDDEGEDSLEDIDENELREDPNVNSLRHKKHTSMEERAQEDMDFPDEVDTPFKEARVRF